MSVTLNVQPVFVTSISGDLGSISTVFRGSEYSAVFVIGKPVTVYKNGDAIDPTKTPKTVSDRIVKQAQALSWI